MKTRFLPIGIVTVLVVIVVALIVNVGSSDGTGPRVAFNIPITGPFGIYGQTIRDGAKMAVAELNSDAILDIQDNTGAPSQAISLFQRQSAGRFDAYVIGVKPQLMAIYDRLVSSSAPSFVWVFDAGITDKSGSIFRTWTNYKYEPGKYLQYIQAREVERIAIACVNFPHTLEEFQSDLIPKLEDRGKFVMMEVYEFDTSRYRDLIVKLAQSKPDLFILNGFQDNLVGLVKALRTYEAIEDGNVIGTFDLLDAANILAPEELEGLRVVAPRFSIDPSDKSQKWTSRFQETHNRKPLYTDAYSYDMMHVIVDAWDRAGRSGGELLRRAILATDLDGVTGRLVFDDTGDLILDLAIGQYRNGRLELAPEEKEIVKP